MTARRFLFLTQTYPRYAGDTAGPFIRELARGLVRRGDGVTVLAPHAAGVGAGWDDDGVAVRTFRYAPERLEVVGYSRSLEKDETMKAGALVATPAYLAGAGLALRRELARGGRDGRSYDLVQGHWVVPNGLVAAWCAGGVPVAAGLHGSDVFLAEKPAVRTLVRRALRRTSVLTGCSPELVDRVCALGFERRRAVVIPYGVDGDLFRPDPSRRAIWRRRLGIPEEAPVILSVGRMATKKGYQVLLDRLDELMAADPAVHLVLAGGGDRLEEFRHRAAAHRERVHFPGAVLRDTLPDLYRAADLFCLPAVHDRKGNVDGLPNVILEAMASALPVVASGISGIPAAIADGVHGRLVPEGDPDALLAALVELLADPERRRALGAAGRERAVSELSWDAVAARYREAYEPALARVTGRP